VGDPVSCATRSAGLKKRNLSAGDGLMRFGYVSWTQVVVHTVRRVCQIYGDASLRVVFSVYTAATRPNHLILLYLHGRVFVYTYSVAPQFTNVQTTVSMLSHEHECDIKF